MEKYKIMGIRCIKVIKDTVSKLREKIKNNRYQILILSILYCVSIYTIIRANYNYADDRMRVITGIRGFGTFHRYISDILSRIIHSSSYLMDVSPLTQILACFFMALAGISVILFVFNKKEIKFVHLIAVLPMGISPYFLQCFSYKYDSPYMALSVLFMVIPFIFINKNKYVYLIITSICTLLMCMSYQTSAGIFPMLVIALIINGWCEGKKTKEIFNLILYSTVGYLIGLLFFKIFIMKPADTYIQNSIPPLNKIVPIVFDNYKKYIEIIYKDFKPLWKVIISLNCIIFIIVSTINSKRNKANSFIVVLILCVMMFIISFGVFPFLEKPSYKPRAMYGIGIFITIINLSILEIANKKILYLPTIAISWCFLSFSFSYGNAIVEQNRYADTKMQLIISDLTNCKPMKNTNKVKTLQINGTIGYTPVIENSKSNKRLLKRLIYVDLRSGKDKWSDYTLFNYYNIKGIKKDEKKDLNKLKLPVLKDTMYYTIRGNDENILIKLK